MRRGEYLLALCEVLKVKHQHREIFTRALAENHAYLFSDDLPLSTFERILEVSHRASES